MRDITETQIRAEKHERLVKLLDTRGLAYFRVDDTGHTVESSEAERILTGYTFSELQKMHRRELYDDPSDQPFLLRKIRERNEQIVHTAQRLKRRDGISFLADGVVHLIRDESGQRFGYEGLYEDVTDRVRLQHYIRPDKRSIIKKQDLYKELERFYHSFQENVRFHLVFMHSVSHQLRSPLSALIENLVNFQDGVTDAARFSSRLKYAIGQVKVCALLIDNLTYMEKVLRDEPFPFIKINIAKLSIDTKLNFMHLAKERDIHINVDSDSISKHLEVLGHPELMRQVLVNLIDNAVKYSLPNTQIRLRGRHNHQGRYLQISNKGIPISREERERIFERGFRANIAEQWSPTGTGLGLWLVRRITKMHGASIRCTEVLEDGEDRTAFQIFFPYNNRLGTRTLV